MGLSLRSNVVSKFLSEWVKVEKKVGSGIEDSELIKGIVIDKERVHSSMPKVIENARIALLDLSLEVKSLETDAKVEIHDPLKMKEFFDMEEKMHNNLVDIFYLYLFVARDMF